MNGPQVLCAVCTKTPVGCYELMCQPCEQRVTELGLLPGKTPPPQAGAADSRIAIGPTDV